MADIKPLLIPLVDKAVEAAKTEEKVRARAAEKVRNEIRDARNTTNEAVLRAFTAGVTKEQLRKALGTSRTTVDNRVNEERDRMLGVAPEAGTTTDEAPKPKSATIFTTKDDTGVTVTLSHFTHPDLGADVSGGFLFDDEGDVIFTDTDALALTEADPLFALKLWSLTEVQDALA